MKFGTMEKFFLGTILIPFIPLMVLAGLAIVIYLMVRDLAERI